MSSIVNKFWIVWLCLAVSSSIASAHESSSTTYPAEHSMPAVDGANGKIAVQKGAGVLEWLAGTGSVAIPLGHRFGLQLDGAVADFDNDLIGNIPVYGAAVHLFWRNPDQALIGIYGQAVHVDKFGGLNYFVSAFELEQYWGQFSFETVVGLANGDHVDAEFYSQSKIAYYPVESLRLDIGHGIAFQNHVFQIGGEWAIGEGGGAATSLFVNGLTTEDGDAAINAGLRFYLGQHNKTLIKRHRQDDPQLPLALEILSSQARTYYNLYTHGEPGGLTPQRPTL